MIGCFKLWSSFLAELEVDIGRAKFLKGFEESLDLTVMAAKLIDLEGLRSILFKLVVFSMILFLTVTPPTSDW